MEMTGEDPQKPQQTRFKIDGIVWKSIVANDYLDLSFENRFKIDGIVWKCNNGGGLCS